MTLRSADRDSLLRARLRVAIDGPAGAGKSTVARGLAKRLGYVLLDTGALYRTVALAARRAALAWDNEAAVGALAQALADLRPRIARERLGAERELAGRRVDLQDLDGHVLSERQRVGVPLETLVRDLRHVE